MECLCTSTTHCSQKTWVSRWPCIHDIKICVLYRCERILYPRWSFMSYGCQDGTVFDSKMCHFHVCFCCLDLFLWYQPHRPVYLQETSKLHEDSDLKLADFGLAVYVRQGQRYSLLGCSPTKIDQMGADQLFERGSQDHFTASTDHWRNPQMISRRHFDRQVRDTCLHVVGR